ncbi:MAG: dihydroorotase family protein [Methanobacterium sp.]|nr:dihydroorotase family protein [Methanobacterium sp.]
MVDLWIKDGKIVPENKLISIGISNGKISIIKKIAPKREEVIDLKGSVILPGFIDAHVHFRDPGLTYKEDFRTGTMSAANGGFTTVMDMPNTLPPTNTPVAFKEKLKIAHKKSLVDYGLHAGVGKLEDIKTTAILGPASFKIFMDQLDDDYLNKVFMEIRNIKEDKGSIKPLITLHCEDKEIVQKNTQFQRNKHILKPEIYAEARPPKAETKAVSKALQLACEYDLNIHICHISTRKSLELISKAKISNSKITCEITPHHLFLDSHFLNKCGNFAKTNPPLRNQDDKLNIRNLSSIDIIGTDHAPHTIAEKNNDIWDAPPGIPNLETTIPLLLTEINRQNITFNHLKSLLCVKPSLIFQLASKGYIKEGYDADLVVVDMKKEDIINPYNFRSKAKYSPFKGFKVKGKPVMTMVRGNVVMDEGEIYKNIGKLAC